MKTFTPKAGDIEEQWFLVDAKDQVLGRLASRIALVLRGKNDPRYTPHANMHNHVVVVNAEKIRLTGKKWSEKTYYSHSGWIGHRGGHCTETKCRCTSKPAADSAHYHVEYCFG